MIKEYLKNHLKGEYFEDSLMKALYATDASVYRKIPLGVAYPLETNDLQILIETAKTYKTSLIPRTAGTSLAGQCVGEGIVVDVSKHFTKILDLDLQKKQVTVQPGVVRDTLNLYLKPYGLFFGPNTSTSNRCMIGGMVGNNSSGTTSIQYGVTRDKVIKLKTLLSDGSEVTFESLSPSEFQEKLKLETLEGEIYRTIHSELSNPENQTRIIAEFPKLQIHRRNTGYAIDELLKSNVFTEGGDLFNMCKLLAGSEGTLAFTTEITLQLDDIPPKESVMIACHFNSISDCLNAVAPLMSHNLHTCEMMDKAILDLTKHNKTQQENRRFIVGDPMAILMCELRATSKESLELQTKELLDLIDSQGLSYAHPILQGENIDKALELRKAGLGLLGNMVGDKKSAACIEDTAVALEDLSSYIESFTKLMDGFGQKAIYYAHAGAGELHLRPILNLKKKEDVVLFREITTAVAKLVKSYHGSMSGEHGDGIVRAEFIPLMIGELNYGILKRIKSAFDPDQIFNPGKIVNAYPMDASLRYEADRVEPEIQTILNFETSQGILRETEKCNGSGDCRKPQEFGGVMCPSYRATRNEKDTTRARANALREFLTQSEQSNRFDHQELKDVFDLCLSCKACTSECPSSVDVASLKAEFLYQYHQQSGWSLRDKVFARNNQFNQFGSIFPRMTNWMFSNTITSNFIKSSLGVARERTLPEISNKSLCKWFQINKNKIVTENYIKEIYLFNDEFTNHLDTSIGIDAIDVLTRLGYKVNMLQNEESGRAMISKGFLKEAKNLANRNILLYKNLVSEEKPLIGIEPSAILSFRDDYLRLADDLDTAKNLAKHTFLLEEFLSNEIAIGNISPTQFTKESKTIKFHGHCHQKALSNQIHSFNILNLPENYKVTIINSGCCGMAGSFGYEKEHYETSMKIGENSLFPTIRRSDEQVIIAANGTSCRHQIKDGTQREAKHPVSILKDALI
ncbi:FAD-binding protein [Mangrovimonas sp. AS39]|uniref:FAD-binding and (Fe-S)-binding domain-containing protein n=1 Tax=Mangrovimonas futianensis TaxID=2895523 RepID=UPI001E2E651D|nr:FAD-binding and (Fe-S)-binding domain-containing protein [Mangrovimonas futianensis]MCF1191777.1 FAD-binding protein [Mangrovimonas futianensis]MCF1195335.1 FAD-binding protein [Mangrovimonas futianensis]